MGDAGKGVGGGGGETPEPGCDAGEGWSVRGQAVSEMVR